jgi:nicotinamide mononucleotide transporter
MPHRVPKSEWAAAGVATAALMTFAALKWLGWVEVFGFLTGGACVWLVVRQHILNWPLGLLNNVVFFILFMNKRLYADMGLQVVFFALGVYGWWYWLRRGPDSAPVRATHASRRELLAAVAFVAAATFGLRELLVWVNGAAPVWDAHTTALSLAAQYLLCRKRVENWYFWIVADVVYVPLYVSRDLPLTAVLYGVFLVMCVVGLVAWRRGMRAKP